MSLITLRQAIVDDLNNNIANLKTCEGHAGRFDQKELQRIATKAPALYTAVLGLDDLEEGHDGVVGTITWTTFVVCRDIPGTSRDEMALAIVQALLLRLPSNRWGLDQSEGRPEKMRAQNLYSSSMDKTGVAMWAVSWRQRMIIGAELDPATLDIFATFDATFDIDTTQTDEPVAEDRVNVPQA